MNTVYRESPPYFEKIDSNILSQKFTKYAEEISRHLNFLDDIKERCEYLHSITEDNGDVGYKLGVAIYYLGVALATCCNYAEAYRDEANGVDDELEENKSKENNS